jgi:hypothetical protein
MKPGHAAKFKDWFASLKPEQWRPSERRAR